MFQECFSFVSNRSLMGKFQGSCAVLFLAAVLAVVAIAKTEVGWTTFYTLGSLHGDAEALLVERGLPGEVRSARLKIGSRAGYAVVKLSPEQAEAFTAVLLQDGYEPFPREEDQELIAEMPDYYEMAVTPQGLPESLRLEVASALAKGNCSVVRGGSDQGRLDLNWFCYLPEQNLAFITIAYRYG